MSNFSKDTIRFLPDRLNRRPIVYKNMTLNELFILCGIGVGIGLIFGIFLTVLFSWKMFAILAFTLLTPIIIVLFGHPVIGRLKRGKPSTWLDRTLLLKFKPSIFVTAEQIWSVKRSPKRPKRSKT